MNWTAVNCIVMYYIGLSRIAWYYNILSHWTVLYWLYYCCSPSLSLHTWLQQFSSYKPGKTKLFRQSTLTPLTNIHVNQSHICTHYSHIHTYTPFTHMHTSFTHYAACSRYVCQPMWRNVIPLKKKKLTASHILTQATQHCQLIVDIYSFGGRPRNPRPSTMRTFKTHTHTQCERLNTSVQKGGGDGTRTIMHCQITRL